MCSCDSGESPEFYTAEWRTAARVHACCECKRPIPVGTLHLYVSGKWEGVLDWFRMCARCDAIGRAHAAAETATGNDGCRAPLGDLFSTIRECVQGDPSYPKALQAEFRKLRATP